VQKPDLVQNKTQSKAQQFTASRAEPMTQTTTNNRLPTRKLASHDRLIALFP
jgi:hypothetical protein